MRPDERPAISEPTYLTDEEFAKQEARFIPPYKKALEEYKLGVSFIPSLNIPPRSTLAEADVVLQQYYSILRKLSRLYNALDEYRIFTINNHVNGELKDGAFRNEIKVLLENYQAIKDRIDRQLSNVSYNEPGRNAFMDKQTDTIRFFDTKIPFNIPVQIYPRQRPHFQRLERIIEKYHVHIDQARPGAGKTYVNLKLVPNEAAVYCPAILCDKWRAVGVELGKTITETLSYEALTGNRAIQSHSKFLVRNSDTSIVTTPAFDDFLRRGGWLIFDEYQRLRNGNSFTAACLALICRLAQARREGWSKSHIALLSGTQGDKDANAYSIILLLGLTNFPVLYQHDYSTKTTAFLQGWEDVKAWMMKVDPVKAGAIYEGHAKPTQMLFRSLIEIVIPTLASRMPVRDMGIYRNGHFQIVPEDREALSIALSELRKAVRPDEGEKRKNSFGKITTALTHVEHALINSMIRDTAILITQFPSCKVILVVWYVESRNRIINQIKEYAITKLGISPEKAAKFVMELGSNISSKKRQENIASFNAHNLDSRVLVMHPEVGGAGIDLDDKVGPSKEFPYGMPRYTLVSPNYSLLTLSQAMARASRANTQTVAFAFIYYAQDTPQQQIMDNLYIKSITANLLGGGEDRETREGREAVESMEDITLTTDEERKVALSYDVVYPSQFASYTQPPIYSTYVDASGYPGTSLRITDIVFPYIDLERKLHPIGDALPLSRP